MTFRRSQGYNNYLGGKQKTDNNKQYYNCNKLGNYRRDCNQPDWREIRESQDSRTPNRLFLCTSQNKNNTPSARHLKKAHQVIADDNSDFSELFVPGLIAKVIIITKSLLSKIEKTCGM